MLIQKWKANIAIFNKFSCVSLSWIYIPIHLILQKLFSGWENSLFGNKYWQNINKYAIYFNKQFLNEDFVKDVPIFPASLQMGLLTNKNTTSFSTVFYPPMTFLHLKYGFINFFFYLVVSNTLISIQALKTAFLNELNGPTAFWKCLKLWKFLIMLNVLCYFPKICVHVQFIRLSLLQWDKCAVMITHVSINIRCN